MSANLLYHSVAKSMQRLLGHLPQPLLKRLGRMTLGMLAAKHCAPAQIAAQLAQMGLGNTESLKRTLRRTENDERITQTRCFHPLVRWHLNRASAETLILALDPTTKRDQVVMVMISVSYRGRSLPLLWTTWPGNTALLGERFWKRIEQLLATLATLVPTNKKIVIVADRAFGTAVFTDLVQKHGWDYLVRVQDQTRCRDRVGHRVAVRHLLQGYRRRAKRRCEVFKKHGWRSASVLVYWGHHGRPWCLVSSLRAQWSLVDWYRRRATIEGLFRDYKSHGWHWEQTQVKSLCHLECLKSLCHLECLKSLCHLECLLVGMAWATWLTVGQGVVLASQYLGKVGTGSRQWTQKQSGMSLFRLGLDQMGCLFWQHSLLHAVHQIWVRLCHPLPDWSACAWSRQIQQQGSREYFYAH